MKINKTDYKRLDTIIQKNMMDDLEKERQILKNDYNMQINKTTLYNIVIWYFLEQMESDSDISIVTLEYLKTQADKTKK